ncbi:MAG: hypothetical protein DHS20C16_30340 [Phycisphaerae bacterium]|nr:MAG: hypothetical protein DHS20C16_30340 [Phycisphaerae bacterium]
MPAAKPLRMPLQVLCTSLLLLAAGCASYRTPGAAADFNILADDDIKEILARRPASPLPAQLATARVQAPRYRSRTTKGYGTGKYSVVTVRDIETDEDFERLRSLPQVEQVATLNRMLLSEHLESDRQLRQAAASLHADLLLLYTFDTSFFVGDVLPPLSVVTLGLSPNQTAEVTTTASAILMDVRTGYIYGSCETTSRKNQIASAWTSGEAVDFMRLKTEREAFEELLDEVETLWKTGVVKEIGGLTASLIGE